MWLNKYFTLLSLGICFTTAVPCHAQTQETAEKRGLPLAVGAGFSDFNLDYGQNRRMNGIAVWGDYYLASAPSFLHRLGIELEGRTINFDRPSSLPRMRQDTLQGGLNATIYRRQKFRFYGKGLAGIGSLDHPLLNGRSHTTDTVYSLGGGLDYRATRDIWLRGDYEQQWWPDIFHSGSALAPSGFSVGAYFNFLHFEGR